MSTPATPAAAKAVLTSTHHTLILIDHQSKMALPVRYQDVAVLRLNRGLVAEAVAGFKVPTI